MRARVIGAVLLAAPMWPGLVAAQDINTIVGDSTGQYFNPGTSIAPKSDTWIGQTFTVPAAQTWLSSVTFQVGLHPEQSNTVFADLVIQGWNSLLGTPTGAEILVDSTRPSPTLPWYDRTSLLTYNVGLTVTPGWTYVAYLRGSADSTAANDFWQMMTWAGSGYTGGHAVHKFENSGWTSWNANPPGDYDVGFKADFEMSQVPEPTTMILLATGLIGLAGVGLKRRKEWGDTT